MFDRLTEAFPVTMRGESVEQVDSVPEVLQNCFRDMGGATLANGFYRFHSPSSAQAGNARCARLVSGFAGNFYCFAFDWFGRELAIDLRKPDGDVIVVDPGGGEYLRSDEPFSSWHDCVAGEEDPLAYPYYLEWREANPDAGPVGFDQCIGYLVPLFLGGVDEISNLALTDREVYFEICVQLSNGAAKLPTGATIDALRISEA
jgi:hypothetical protein